MRILVTGSEGNVGSVLVPYLQEKGHEVFGVDIVQRFANNYKVVDINHPLELSEVFRIFKPEVCYHLAAMVSRVTCENSPALTIQTNVTGTHNVITLCRIYDVRLMFFSTSEVYGNLKEVLSENNESLATNNIYGISKVIAEQLVKYNISCGLRAVIIRPFMMYREGEKTGEHHSALIRFCDGLIRRQKITVHKGAVRSWLHINDAVHIFELLLYENGNYTINVGSPHTHSMVELAHLICDRLKLNYSDYVVESELPERMTLIKVPDLKLQFELTGFISGITIEQGIDRIIKKMLCE